MVTGGGGGSYSLYKPEIRVRFEQKRALRYGCSWTRSRNPKENWSSKEVYTKWIFFFLNLPEGRIFHEYFV